MTAAAEMRAGLARADKDELTELTLLPDELSPLGILAMEPFAATAAAAAAAAAAGAAAAPMQLISPIFDGTADFLSVLDALAVPSDDLDVAMPAGGSPPPEVPDLSDLSLNHMMADVVAAPPRQPRQPRRPSGAPALLRTPSSTEILRAVETPAVLKAPPEQWRQFMAQARAVLTPSQVTDIKKRRRRALGVNYARKSRMVQRQARDASDGRRAELEQALAMKDKQIAALKAEVAALRGALAGK